MSEKYFERNLPPDNNNDDDPEAEPQGIRIPDNEYTLSFSLSSGPGGQHGDKANTRVELRFNIYDSKTLDIEERDLVLSHCRNQINQAGDLIIKASAQRSQDQNRKAAIRKLNQMIDEALAVPEPRIPTKPSKNAKAERLRDKRSISKKKKSRSKFSNDLDY